MWTSLGAVVEPTVCHPDIIQETVVAHLSLTALQVTWFCSLEMLGIIS